MQVGTANTWIFVSALESLEIHSISLRILRNTGLSAMRIGLQEFRDVRPWGFPGAFDVGGLLCLAPFQRDDEPKEPNVGP